MFAAFLVIAGGCGKKAAEPAPAQSQAATTSATQPLAGAVNAEMTAQLHIFEQQTGRLPTNFTELARARLDLVPRHPPGMQWAIDPTTHEVKLVKQ